MKKDTHPESRFVVFMDTSCDHKFRIRSTMKSEETTTWEEDGQEYPLVRIEISSASHPIYTGKARGVTKEGRVARFNTKFGTQDFKL